MKEKTDKKVFHDPVIVPALNGPVSRCMRANKFFFPVIEQETKQTRDFQVIYFRTGLGVKSCGSLVRIATACTTMSGSGTLSARHGAIYCQCEEVRRL